MKKFIYLLLLTQFIYNFIKAQKSQVNDSTYINIIEQKDTRDITLNAKAAYKIRVLFSGYFKNDSVKIVSNSHVLYSGKLTTIDENSVELTQVPVLTLKIRKNKSSNYCFIFNGVQIPFSVVRGYSLLYIQYSRYRVFERQVDNINFLYTNRPLVDF